MDQKDGTDWEAKERRIIRQNVLARAVELFIAHAIKEDAIISQAETFEEWIWREDGARQRTLR